MICVSYLFVLCNSIVYISNYIVSALTNLGPDITRIICSDYVHNYTRIGYLSLFAISEITTA